MVKVREAPPRLENGSIDIDSWLEQLSDNRSFEEMALLKKACQCGVDAGLGLVTSFGESCFYQGMMMAEILHDLGLDTSTLAAAILYHTSQFAPLTPAYLQKQLGEEVEKLIIGVQKIDAVPADHAIGQIENLRRMLLSIVEDVRMVLIKLASHTCEMRAAVRWDEIRRRRIAEETQEIYAPLANRLGIGQIKWELEDLAFRFLEPDRYKEIARLLDERRLVREDYIDNVKDTINVELKAHAIHAMLYGRAKHIYSIWKKMQRKGVGYDEIYDVRAIRIIVQNVRDCYAALGTVHTLWQHIPKEFDDYIANPKNNGYRSLHTAVIGPEGKTLEVQIRTPDMNEQAELGVAAHWRYKENLNRDAQYEAKLANLRQVLKWQEEWVIDAEPDALKAEVFHDRVYVLTPKGAVVDLLQGATVLDFAYHVHTEIGHRCRGAKINGRMVSLTHPLKSGDRVEILTAKSGGPSRDWLNRDLGFLKSSRARAKVLQWFKKQDREQNIVDGRESLERELKRLGVENISISNISQQLKIDRVEDMLAALGGGELRIGQVLAAIQSLIQPFLAKSEQSFEIKAPTRQSIKPTEVMVQGVGNLLCHMARCCKPAPGDEIIGYITLGRGVSVHRKDCMNILQAKANKLNRLIQVEWGQKTENQYKVDIRVRAHDREGLIRDISSILAMAHINVVSLTTITSKKDHSADFKLTVEIPGLEILSKVLHRIQQIPNVIEVKRVGE